jgi:hypothetical protein
VFRELILQIGTSTYVAKKLDQMPNYFSLFKIDPLRILFPSHLSWSGKRPQVLDRLLEHGLDPNEIVGSYWQTNWTSLVTCLIRNGDDFISAVEHGIFTVFLQHGANPNAVLRCDQRPVWISFLNFGLVAIFRKKEHVPRLLTHADRFVKGLESFMVQGADFSLLNRAVTSGELGGTHWTEIQNYLKEASGMVDRLPFQQRHFFARVMKLLIEYGAKSDLPWTDLEPILQECFPPSLVQPMLNIINGNDIGTQGGMGKAHTGSAKRIREDDEYSSVGEAGASTGSKLRRYR